MRDLLTRLLFSSTDNRRKLLVPKGPSLEVIAAVVEMKTRNPRFGFGMDRKGLRIDGACRPQDTARSAVESLETEAMRWPMTALELLEELEKIRYPGDVADKVGRKKA